MAVAALIVAIVAALAAVGAVWYARWSAQSAKRSADAADRSAVADAESAAIEAERRHEELTPHFRVSVEPTVSILWRLTVLLEGPAALGRLDGLTVTIRDGRPNRARGPHLAGAPTSEEEAAQVWGPLRFAPGTWLEASPTGELGGADPTGRTTDTGGMAVGGELDFPMEPTPDWPPKMGTVLRLQLEARRDGLEPWTLPCEINFGGESRTVEVP